MSNPLLADYPFLTDENIHPHVVAFLRARGLDVWDMKEQHRQSASDRELLTFAHSQGRVVLTHDSDFETLATAIGLEWTGIVYLRPGLEQVNIVLENLDVALSHDLRPTIPFIMVVERKGERVKIRVR